MHTHCAPLSHCRRRGSVQSLLTIGLALLVVVAAAGAIAWQSGFFDAAKGPALLTEKVKVGDLVVMVTEDGTLESSSNLDVKCEVAGGSTILWIVKDGSEVKEGDELVRLDSSTIEELIDTQTIAYEKATALRIESEKNYSAAKIAVSEYTEGTFLKELQTAQANITIAMENLRTAENSLTHTERMVRKGYVTALQRDAQAFAVQKAKLDMQIAETTKDVLEKFTREKMLGDLTSKRDAMEAGMRSNQAAVELEGAKLKRLKSQLEKCVIIAPQDGLVVYANEGGGWRGGQPNVQVEEGAAIRERQSIIRLPDLQRMQAKVLIHESKIDQVEIGMRARVRVQGRDYPGTVVSIANQAEQNNWLSSGAKKFATLVRIEGTPSDLLPGMTSAVTILIADRTKVLTVPVQSLVESSGQFSCWVLNGGAPQRRTVTLGVKGIDRVEILKGLEKDDTVLLDPRNQVAEARDALRTRKEIDVKHEFGEPREMPTGAVAAGPNGLRGGRGSRGEGGPGSEARGNGRRGDGGRGEGGGRPSFDIMQLDADGDKRISSDEVPAGPMKDNFAAMDTNHDGFLDSKEIAAVRRIMRQMQQGGPPGDGAAGNGGAGGPGGTGRGGSAAGARLPGAGPAAGQGAGQ